MAFIEVPNVIEAALQFECEGSQLRNIINFRFPGVGLEASMDGLLAELAGWYEDTLTLQSGTNLQFTGIKLTALATADGRVLEWAPATTVYGAAGGPGAPANVTLALKLGTGYRGRSAMGRVFLNGVPQDVVSGSYVSSTFRDDVVECWTQLLDDGVIFAHKLCVVSRFHEGAPRTQGITHDVTVITANTVVDSQRRRLPGRGK